jgi:hypothetical protein
MFDSRRYQIFWEVVGLEQVRSALEEKVAIPVKKVENTAVWTRCADHATPSTRKSWH